MHSAECSHVWMFPFKAISESFPLVSHCAPKTGDYVTKIDTFAFVVAPCLNLVEPRKPCKVRHAADVVSLSFPERTRNNTKSIPFYWQ